MNEIKQDISAFRCELVEILKNSGMNTETASGQGSGRIITKSFGNGDLIKALCSSQDPAVKRIVKRNAG